MQGARKKTTRKSVFHACFCSFNEILEKSRVFTHVHPDKQIESFEASLLQAAGKQKVALNCYGSELPL
jgi:hypothetical protein